MILTHAFIPNVAVTLYLARRRGLPFPGANSSWIHGASLILAAARSLPLWSMSARRPCLWL